MHTRLCVCVCVTVCACVCLFVFCFFPESRCGKHRISDAVMYPITTILMYMLVAYFCLCISSVSVLTIILYVLIVRVTVHNMYDWFQN